MNVPMSNETDTSQPREDLFLKNTMTQHTEEGLNLNLKHTKQDSSIIEFKNHVGKFLILIEVLILILGSKIHNFLWKIFCRTKISLKIQPEIPNLGF